jgi:hypothetical protein
MRENPSRNDKEPAAYRCGSQERIRRATVSALGGLVFDSTTTV